MNTKQAIIEGKTALGIELGSTRIKAVLIDEEHIPIASGSYDWENKLIDGVWTYSLDDVWIGLQASFRALADDVQRRYGAALTTTGAIGISGMMHGYLAFDVGGRQLVPFRTWRNTITEEAAAALTADFNFNIPQRWSVAHLYQAILNGEDHVSEIGFITTLSGYVHWKLTGRKVLGIGDASGMFPIDSGINNYDPRLLARFTALVPGKRFCWRLAGILPEVKCAGENAGSLTAEGSRLLDGEGRFAPGIPLCPPEGDAGTGMAATNSVAERTGNVSAGTSIFAMLVLEKPLAKVWTEIDMVTTPTGKPVAMVHCNNCTSDLDAWARLFKEALELFGGKVEKAALYDALYFKALEGEPDCGGVLSYNYYSGEPITGLENGKPLLLRAPDSRFTLANFMRAQLFSTMATLKIGMDILTEQEKARLSVLLGHGGLFKTKGVGQRLMAAALNVPVAVMDSAGEGGAWGIALLAAFRLHKKRERGLGDREQELLTAAYDGERSGESLETYLAERVFAGKAGTRVEPDADDVRGFEGFMRRYKEGLAVEKAAVGMSNEQ